MLTLMGVNTWGERDVGLEIRENTMRTQVGVKGFSILMRKNCFLWAVAQLETRKSQHWWEGMALLKMGSKTALRSTFLCLHYPSALPMVGGQSGCTQPAKGHGARLWV